MRRCVEDPGRELGSVASGRVGAGTGPRRGATGAGRPEGAAEAGRSLAAPCAFGRRVMYEQPPKSRENSTVPRVSKRRFGCARWHSAYECWSVRPSSSGRKAASDVRIGRRYDTPAWRKTHPGGIVATEPLSCPSCLFPRSAERRLPVDTVLSRKTKTPRPPDASLRTISPRWRRKQNSNPPVVAVASATRRSTSSACSSWPTSSCASSPRCTAPHPRRSPRNGSCSGCSGKPASGKRSRPGRDRAGCRPPGSRPARSTH